MLPFPYGVRLLHCYIPCIIIIVNLKGIYVSRPSMVCWLFFGLSEGNGEMPPPPQPPSHPAPHHPTQENPLCLSRIGLIVYITRFRHASWLANPGAAKLVNRGLNSYFSFLEPSITWWYYKQDLYPTQVKDLETFRPQMVLVSASFS